MQTKIFSKWNYGSILVLETSLFVRLTETDLICARMYTFSKFRCPCRTLREEYFDKSGDVAVFSVLVQPAPVDLDSHYHDALLRFTDAFSPTLLGCHLHRSVQ